jgi:hypothetical protein
VSPPPTLVPVPAQLAEPAAGSNPFGGFSVDEPAAPSAGPAPVRTVEATLEVEEPPAPRRGRQPADDPVKPWKLAVYGLAVYALLMTILAVYGLTRSPSGDHPTQPTKKGGR